MSTPTPRTDAVIWPYMTFDGAELVPVELARTLERELHESRNAERLARVQLGNERARHTALRRAVLDVLCDPEGEACFYGTDADRAAIDSAMKEGAK
jgi:hypothetical protein